MALPTEFWQGVEEFNAGQFYPCHDTLEAIWIEALEPEKKFYQGVLQLAVGCYHLENHNWRGAVILLGEGLNRLSGYGPEFEGVDVSDLMAQAAQLLQVLQTTGEAGLAQCLGQLQVSSVARLDNPRSPSEPSLSWPQITTITPKA